MAGKKPNNPDRISNRNFHILKDLNVIDGVDKDDSVMDAAIKPLLTEDNDLVINSNLDDNESIKKGY